MKKSKNLIEPKENLKITEQKLYQRKIKTIPEEKQTLLKETKKPKKAGK